MEKLSHSSGFLISYINLLCFRVHIPARDGAQFLHPAQAGHTPRAYYTAASPVLPAVPGYPHTRPPRQCCQVVVG